MPTGLYIRFVAFVFTAILCVAIVYAWRANRRDRAQLAVELAATKQLLVAAGARQHNRDTQLAQTLAALAKQKGAVATPAQILSALPKTLPLPEPITLQADGASSAGALLASPPATMSQSNQKQPDGAFIPRADLKPLYDFTLDCQACQARLSAAQSDFATKNPKPPPSPKSATTPCVSPKVAALGDGSPAPPNGSSSVPPPTPSWPKPANGAPLTDIFVSALTPSFRFCIHLRYNPATEMLSQGTPHVC